MKTFLCILAVASVANATLELPNLFGGGGSSGGRSRSNSRPIGGSGGGPVGGLGETLGEGLKGLTSLLGGSGGPAISTHHQLDHNVNVVHHYASQGYGASSGVSGDNGAQVVHVVENNGGGWSQGNQQDVQVIRVIHEEAAPVYHGHGASGYGLDGHGSGGHVKIIKVLHQEPTGWK